jgi:hypothetical protein
MMARSIEEPNPSGLGKNDWKICVDSLVVACKEILGVHQRCDRLWPTKFLPCNPCMEEFYNRRWYWCDLFCGRAQ